MDSESEMLHSYDSHHYILLVWMKINLDLMGLFFML